MTKTRGPIAISLKKITKSAPKPGLSHQTEFTSIYNVREFDRIRRRYRDIEFLLGFLAGSDNPGSLPDSLRIGPGNETFSENLQTFPI